MAQSNDSKNTKHLHELHYHDSQSEASLSSDLSEAHQEETQECPLCTEAFDATDKNFKPCKCGYQVCCWCWNHLMEKTDGRCPHCRREYDVNNFEFIPLDAEIIEREKRKLEHKSKKKNHMSRKQLANVRVIQRNLVYAVGLTLNVAKEEFLRSEENFGKYGKITKIVVNKSNLHNSAKLGSTRAPTVSAYITYSKPEEALLCIQAIDSTWLDDKQIRCSFGTTKYCAYFLRDIPCTNPDCMYLHYFGENDDTFNKEDIVLKNGLPIPSKLPHPYPQPLQGSIQKHVWNYIPQVPLAAHVNNSTTSNTQHQLFAAQNQHLQYQAESTSPHMQDFDEYEEEQDGEEEFEEDLEEEEEPEHSPPQDVVANNKSQSRLPATASWAKRNEPEPPKQKTISGNVAVAADIIAQSQTSDDKKQEKRKKKDKDKKKKKKSKQQPQQHEKIVPSQTVVPVQELTKKHPSNAAATIEESHSIAPVIKHQPVLPFPAEPGRRTIAVEETAPEQQYPSIIEPVPKIHEGEQSTNANNIIWPSQQNSQLTTEDELIVGPSSVIQSLIHLNIEEDQKQRQHPSLLLLEEHQPQQELRAVSSLESWNDPIITAISSDNNKRRTTSRFQFGGSNGSSMHEEPGEQDHLFAPHKHSVAPSLQPQKQQAPPLFNTHEVQQSFRALLPNVNINFTSSLAGANKRETEQQIQQEVTEEATQMGMWGNSPSAMLSVPSPNVANAFNAFGFPNPMVAFPGFAPRPTSPSLPHSTVPQPPPRQMDPYSEESLFAEWNQFNPMMNAKQRQQQHMQMFYTPPNPFYVHPQQMGNQQHAPFYMSPPTQEEILSNSLQERKASRSANTTRGIAKQSKEKPFQEEVDNPLRNGHYAQQVLFATPHQQSPLYGALGPIDAHQYQWQSSANNRLPHMQANQIQLSNGNGFVGKQTTM